jgi:hypothetical protein
VTQNKAIGFIAILAAIIAGGWHFFSRPDAVHGVADETSLSQSDDLNGFLNQPIIVGQGVGNIQLKKTTLGEVVATLGNKFERREMEGNISTSHGCVDGVCDQTTQNFKDIILDYSAYGIVFGFRAVESENVAENDLKLRVISLTRLRKGGYAFKGKTAEGIHLGSTRKEVETALGQSDTWTGRQGSVSKKSGINIEFTEVHPTPTGYTHFSDDDPVESFELFSPEDYSQFQRHSI